MRSLDHLGRSSEAEDRKKTKKVKCDGRMDGPTDQPNKRGVELLSTRLKISTFLAINFMLGLVRTKRLVNFPKHPTRKKPLQVSTRLDTRPPVADGWAGAEMRIFPLSTRSLRTNGPRDGLTDGLTDGRTDEASYRFAY